MTPPAFTLITKVGDGQMVAEKAIQCILITVVELAPLRPVRHQMGKPYIKEYFKNFPVSDPEEDQDDRNALYCL